MECDVSSECDRKAPYGEAMTQNRVETPQEKKIVRYNLKVCKE